MIVFKCLMCKTQVVNLYNEMPRSCKQCHSGPAWLMAIADDNGPLPGSWTDAKMSASTARWIPD